MESLTLLGAQDYPVGQLWDGPWSLLLSVAVKHAEGVVGTEEESLILDPGEPPETIPHGLGKEGGREEASGRPSCVREVLILPLCHCCLPSFVGRAAMSLEYSVYHPRLVIY